MVNLVSPVVVGPTVDVVSLTSVRKNNIQKEHTQAVDENKERETLYHTRKKAALSTKALTVVMNL